MNDQARPPRPGLPIRWLIPPVAALQFLTLAPPIVRRMFTAPEMGAAVGYFPLIGALLGALLALLDWGLGFVFPAAVSTVLILVASVLFTGALHLDGFLDACDGLFGGHTPERRLEIMRDERVGAFGLAGGVLLILLKWSALTALTDRAVPLILALTLSRWAMSLAIVAAPYARPQGLGRAIKDHAGKAQILLSTVWALGIALLAGHWLGLFAALVTLLTTWLFARLALRLVPGLTGDLYGAISEGVEVVVLLIYAGAGQ